MAQETILRRAIQTAYQAAREQVFSGVPRGEFSACQVRALAAWADAKTALKEFHEVRSRIPTPRVAR